MRTNKGNRTPEDNGICSICGDELEPVYENNGFNPPDPTHYEIVGYKTCPCIITEVDVEDHDE